jgi:hypothetical protein
MITDGTSQDTGSTGLSEDQAAERIADLLTPRGDSAEGETPKEPKAKAEDAPDTDEDEPDAEEAEDDAPEDESDEADEPEEEAPEPKTFTVKIDGEEVAVTEDELLRGYSRTQDYTRKTMELAEARKALEPERQALREEREQYANLLPQLFAKLNEQAQSAELEQLRHTDPGEWAARMREIERQEAAIRSEYERVTKQQAEEEAAETQAKRREEAEKLLAAVPEFQDPKNFEEMRGYALQAGFTPEELAETDNHRAFVVLWKALQYDRLKAKAPQVKARVEAVKTAKPGATSTQPSKVTDLTRAKQRLAKTGRVEDAQAAIERMLG